MLETVIGLLAALSIASERLVEIIKGVVPYLNTAKPDPKAEGIRKTILQCLAVVAGIGTTLCARVTGSIPDGSLPPGWNTPVGIFTVGLLVSGGSGLWNAILSYVFQVKELKKNEVNSQKSS